MAATPKRPDPPEAWDPTWEPLAKYDWETPDSWWALLEYCMMGEERTLAGLAEQLAQSDNPVPTTSQYTLEGWSRYNHWLARAEQFDVQRRALQLSEFLDEDLKAARRRRRIADQLLEITERMNARLLEKKSGLIVTPRDVAGFAKVALDESRQEHSGYSEVVKHDVEVGADEELVELLRRSIESRLTQSAEEDGEE